MPSIKGEPEQPLRVLCAKEQPELKSTGRIATTSAGTLNVEETTTSSSAPHEETTTTTISNSAM